MEQGFPGFLSDPLQLCCLLCGIKQLEGISPNSRLPVTPSLLRRFHCLLHLAHYDNTMLWAAILVTFFNFSGAVSFWHCRTTRMYFRDLRSTTDPFWHGATVKLTPSGDNALHCTELPAGCVSLKTPGSSSVLKTGPSYRTHWHLNTLIRELAGHT